MGCDIHIVVETRNTMYQGMWHAEPIIHSVWRNYDLFTKLAGVRNTGRVMPIALPRGIPADSPAETRELLSDVDYHSHSWISSQEFKANWPFPAEERQATDWTMLGWYWLIWGRDMFDMRLVFAFDN